MSAEVRWNPKTMHYETVDGRDVTMDYDVEAHRFVFKPKVEEKPSTSQPLRGSGRLLLGGLKLVLQSLEALRESPLGQVSTSDSSEKASATQTPKQSMTTTRQQKQKQLIPRLIPNFVSLFSARQQQVTQESSTSQAKKAEQVVPRKQEVYVEVVDPQSGLRYLKKVEG